MAYFALIPAAGGGTRMGGMIPKQYLSLAGVPMIRHALTTLCAVPAIERVFVVLSPDDTEWNRYDWSDLPKVTALFCGARTRAQSVTNGLYAVVNRVETTDWMLVHDAARACLTSAQVERLIDEVGDDDVGGLLAVPVADTLKRATTDGRIQTTVSREGLWQAQTPQMFRYGPLLGALQLTSRVTDEAGAMEAIGHSPKLVVGDASNLKITWPSDLQLAENILKGRTP
ncbi:MAG: 2-C-methyl-D-erythritol 4-phosphate cytidylyltransferase [Rhodocyclaceae bacterium]|nr:2-C-methyl-D-erythritol 4-phosphate cytidylyltransferase [Rhodocyclaceae bacterium]